MGALLSHPGLLARLAIMSANWIVITLCFYGLSLNSAHGGLYRYYMIIVILPLSQPQLLFTAGWAAWRAWSWWPTW